MKQLIILDFERLRFPSTSKVFVNLYMFIEEIYLRILYNMFVIPKLKKIMNKDKKAIIIAVDIETQKILSKKKIPFKQLSDYSNSIDFRESTKKAMCFVRSLTTNKLISGINYKGLNLWSMDEANIYDAFFKLIITEIDILEKIIEIEKPKKLVIMTTSLLGNIQQLYETDKRLKVKSDIDILSRLKTFMMNLLMPIALKTIHTSFLKKIKKGNNRGSASKDVFFIGMERLFKYSIPVLKRFPNQVSVLINDYDDEKIEKKYKHKKELTFITTKDYLTKSSKKDLLRFKKELKSKWNTLKKSNQFQNLFVYKKELFKLFIPMFYYYFSMGFLESAFYFEIFTNFLEKRHPKIIVHLDEMPKENKILIHLAKNKNIPVLQIAHGAMADEIMFENQKSDKIVVFSNKARNLLKRKKYPLNNIIITGNPFWDNMFKKKYNRDEFCKKFNISTEKKIITFATIPSPYNERNDFTYSVLDAAKKFRDYQWVIKIRPGDDMNFYKKAAEKTGINAIFIEDVSILHDLLNASDLVIVSQSTVGLEAVLLDKPVIDINLTAAPFFQEYIKYNAAISIRDRNKIVHSIKYVLNNQAIRKNLKKNRNRFLKEFVTNTDGRASERIEKIIRKMANLETIPYFR